MAEHPHVAKMGRPTLEDQQLGEVFGRLSLLEKGTDEYRQTRRELAQKFERTERSIDDIFDRIKRRFLEKESERGHDERGAA